MATLNDISSIVKARLGTAKAAQGNASEAWQIQPLQVRRINQISSIVPIVYKGTTLPLQVPFVAAPAPAIVSPTGIVPPIVVQPGKFQINLGSPAVSVRGSFAPTITDAGFTYIALEDQVTIYWDGTNGSKRGIKQRRTDGFNETIPQGFITIQGLTPGAPGAAEGPSYDLIPFYVPGSCTLSWVAGNSGTPSFAFASGSATADDLNKANIQGREPIAQTVLTIQLQPVPAPAPPPTQPDPGTQVGNTAVNGTVTATVDVPGADAIMDILFNISAHASDSSGLPITGWHILEDGANVLLNQFGTTPTPSVSVALGTNPGNHNIVVSAYNSEGTHADVTLFFTTQDFGGGGTGGGGTPPTSPPKPPPPPQPPTGCVMLGTVIETLGPAPWHREQMAQNDWVRLFTNRNRELICTPDHPVFTSRAGRTEARDVRKGDKIICIEGEETIIDVKAFMRAGIKVRVHMDWGHLFWANGFLSHNFKPVLGL